MLNICIKNKYAKLLLETIYLIMSNILISLELSFKTNIIILCEIIIILLKCQIISSLTITTIDHKNFYS